MFLNISNHPSQKWGESQKSEAERNGEIVDIPFPNIPPHFTGEEVKSLARDMAKAIYRDYDSPFWGDMAMVQGEFSFTHHLTSDLKALGWMVVVACSERVVEDLPDGGKKTTFNFVQFREV